MRPGEDRKTWPTTTVLVKAVTRPPVPGFRLKGQVIGFGEEVRVPLIEAKDLERRGKARIIDGSDELVTM